MSKFDNVSVEKKANVYFDGKVISHVVLFANGTKKTLGVMLPGDYEFGTAEKELMEIQDGEMEILLPGESEWKQIKGGESFEVPANSKFGVKAKSICDYCCSYFS